MRYVRHSSISGKIDAPASKSMMQRAAIVAALAEGESIIKNPSFCDDAIATMRVVKTLGAKVEQGDNEVRIIGGGAPIGDTLDCGESGTCMRMIAAVAALHLKEFTITGRGTLLTRPVGMIEGPLRALLAECRTNNGKPPITVKGPLDGGIAWVDGSESSQLLSGLLMVLPLCDKGSEVRVQNLKSKGYVRMTQRLLSEFGVDINSDISFARFVIDGKQRYVAREYTVEGDWSGAASMLVAGAIAGEVEVNNLRTGFQPDESVKRVLMDAGAKVECSEGSVRVSKAELRAFEFDATDSPDLFPPLAALACACEGKSVIHGADRLKDKESDRAAALVEGFSELGADIKVVEKTMEIIGGRKLRGGILDPRKDHRIVMAGAVLALVSEEGVTIKDEGYVAKSFPNFFTHLESLMR